MWNISRFLKIISGFCKECLSMIFLIWNGKLVSPENTELMTAPNQCTLEICFLHILFNGFLYILTVFFFFPNQTLCVLDIGGRKQLSAWVMEIWLYSDCQHLPLLFPSDWDFPETEHPRAAEKQLFYTGSLCRNLKRIMTLPRRLQIKWHKPWCCCSSLIYPPIQVLEWFFPRQQFPISLAIICVQPNTGKLVVIKCHIWKFLLYYSISLAFGLEGKLFSVLFILGNFQTLQHPELFLGGILHDICWSRLAKIRQTLLL